MVCLWPASWLHCAAPPPSLLPGMQGLSSKEFAVALGYNGQEEICHRANICLLVSHHDDSDAGGRGMHLAAGNGLSRERLGTCTGSIELVGRPAGSWLAGWLAAA